MHTIERELIKATGYKVQRKFADRQDYLKSLLNAVEKLENDDFMNLTDWSAKWANVAVEAHNIKGRDLPDFDEVPPDDDDVDALQAAKDEPEDDAEPDTDPEDEGEDEGEDAPESVEAVDAEEDDEPEAETEPVKAKKSAKKAAPAKKAPAKKRPSTNDPAEAALPPKTSKLARGSDEDVVIDKWGLMEGSKNSQAMNLFEKGATTREVREKLGGTYYNTLKDMVQKRGHKIVKEGAVTTLIHKDANKPPTKKKK